MKRMFLSLAALTALQSVPASAQSYPARPIRIIVGYAPGGAVDVSARAIARKLSEAVGQQVVVENRAGGSGNTAAGLVAKSPPDGYTLFMASSTIAFPSLFVNLPFDVRKDLAPISLVAMGPSVLVTHPSVPVNSVKELVAFSKSRPKQLAYGSAGYGTVIHLGMEILMFRTGVDMIHVPYKGSGQSVVGLLSGEVHVLFASIPSVLGQVNARKARALGVSTLKRSISLPGVPTIDEAGLPGYSTASWYGLLAPPGIARQTSDFLSAEVAKIMQNAEIRDSFIRAGFEPEGSSPESFGTFIRSEIVKYEEIIKKANIKPESD